MPKVSLITLNYNGLDVLKKCVESVRHQCTGIDWEWIIGENGSTDGSLEWLQQLADSRIKIVQRTNEGNFSSMNNELARHACGDYLLFLNNDTEALNDFLLPMVQLMEQDSEVGVVGANLWYPNNKLQHCGVVISQDLSPVNISDPLYENSTIYRRLHEETREYHAVTGACLLISKQDFDDLWGFDPNYHWAYEDVDLCLKVKYHKQKKIVGCARATLRHFESYSKANPNLRANADFFRNRWSSVISTDLFSYSGDSHRYAKSKKVADLTFVVCTHNLKLLNECVVSSLKKQASQNFDLQVVYNFDNRYSAAQALNIGMRRAKTDFVVLSHHDVQYNPKWTATFLKEIAKYQGFGVAGLAGVKWLFQPAHKGVPVNPAENIWVHCFGEVTYPHNGKTHKYGQFSDGKVDVVDELCIILKKSNGLIFDETNNDFHFYGPDISLQSKEKGFFNAVINCPAFHKSDGSSSLKKGMAGYWREFRKAHIKWKNKFPTVVTTTGYWHADQCHTFYKEEDQHQVSRQQHAMPNHSVELALGSTQRFEISDYQKGSDIAWYVNDERISHNLNYYLFEPPTKGFYRIAAAFANSVGLFQKKEWMVNVISLEDSSVVLGMQQNFHSHTLGEIFGNKKISQEIIVDTPQLCRVDLFLGTFLRINTCKLSLSVTTALQGDLLRYSFINGENVIDNDWASFYFDPIDAIGKKLVLNLESKNAEPGNALTAYFVNHAFGFGHLYLNHKKVNGCLTFRLFYKTNSSG